MDGTNPEVQKISKASSDNATEWGALFQARRKFLGRHARAIYTTRRQPAVEAYRRGMQQFSEEPATVSSRLQSPDLHRSD